AALLLFAPQLELELAIVHNLADRRPLLGRHLDQVQAGLASHLQRLRGRYEAVLLTGSADETDGTNAYLLVGAVKRGWGAVTREGLRESWQRSVSSKVWRHRGLVVAATKALYLRPHVRAT